jgi:dTDP-4-amino-4,6-dideoxygalactose transaminase
MNERPKSGIKNGPVGTNTRKEAVPVCSKELGAETGVPFLDLKAQIQQIKPEVREALDKVLDSCSFVLGEDVRSFEGEFAAYCRAKFGVAVNSGTSALHLALLAAGIGPGDEVITVPFTFVATVAAVLYAGAMPVLVDVDSEYLTMDPERVEAAITPRTRAIMPVHLYGQPADMDPIMEIARRRNLLVIEDAAQAHGAEYKGRRAGAIGDMGCFSFYPGKNLGACGEGGMVITDNPAFAKTVSMLRDWGQERKYNHVLKGFNFRMEGFQGAILRVKLRHLEHWTEGRRNAAACYEKHIADAGIGLPTVRPECRHVHHVYAVRHPERDRLQQELGKRGVQTGIHYPIPVHLQPAYSDLGYKEGDFPVSEKAAGEVLSLPMFPELTEAQVLAVCSAVREAVHER